MDFLCVCMRNEQRPLCHCLLYWALFGSHNHTVSLLVITYTAVLQPRLNRMSIPWINSFLHVSTLMFGNGFPTLLNFSVIFLVLFHTWTIFEFILSPYMALLPVVCHKMSFLFPDLEVGVRPGGSACSLPSLLKHEQATFSSTENLDSTSTTSYPSSPALSSPKVNTTMQPNFQPNDNLVCVQFSSIQHGFAVEIVHSKIVVDPDISILLTFSCLLLGESEKPPGVWGLRCVGGSTSATGPSQRAKGPAGEPGQTHPSDAKPPSKELPFQWPSYNYLWPLNGQGQTRTTEGRNHPRQEQQKCGAKREEGGEKPGDEG